MFGRQICLRCTAVSWGWSTVKFNFDLVGIWPASCTEWLMHLLHQRCWLSMQGVYCGTLNANMDVVGPWNCLHWSMPSAFAFTGSLEVSTPSRSCVPWYRSISERTTNLISFCGRIIAANLLVKMMKKHYWGHQQQWELCVFLDVCNFIDMFCCLWAMRQIPLYACQLACCCWGPDSVLNLELEL